MIIDRYTESFAGELSSPIVKTMKQKHDLFGFGSSFIKKVARAHLQRVFAELLFPSIVQCGFVLNKYDFSCTSYVYKTKTY